MPGISTRPCSSLPEGGLGKDWSFSLPSWPWLVRFDGCRLPQARPHRLFLPLAFIPAQAIADHIESNHLNLFVGASVGPQLQDRWAKLDTSGWQGNRPRYQISPVCPFSSLLSLSHGSGLVLPQDLTWGYYNLAKTHGDLDKGYCRGNRYHCHIVPGASVGATPEIVQTSSKSTPGFPSLHDINPSLTPM